MQSNYSVVQLYDGQVQMVPPQALQLNEASMNPPAQLVVMNGQAQLAFTQPNTPISLNSRIPNSPFQPYTIKKETVVAERMDNNDVFLIDDDCVIVEQQEVDRHLNQGHVIRQHVSTELLYNQQMEQDNGDIIEAIKGKYLGYNI